MATSISTLQGIQKESLSKFGIESIELKLEGSDVAIPISNLQEDPVEGVLKIKIKSLPHQYSQQEIHASICVYRLL